jgi:Winged helix DNA-binding domain
MRTEGQLTPHLLHRAALRGVIVRTEETFVLAGPLPRVDRDAALAELARRYLVAHGPATAGDLARWIGLPLRDARAGLRAIGPLEEDGDLVDLPGRAPPPQRIPPRLLGMFDPYLLGWRDRSFAVPAEHARAVHPGGGMVRAVATVDGLVVGTWTQRGGIEPFAPLDVDFAAELADVARFSADGAAPPAPRRPPR